MKIEHFIKRDYITASAFAGIADLKDQLIKHSAIVIMEDEQFFGVLTTTDIFRKPHTIAIDCLCNKSSIESSNSISNVLFYMKNEHTDVLPVIDHSKFVGLVFKSDILEFLNEHNKELQVEIEQRTRKLEEQNNEFQIKIDLQKKELEGIIEQRTKELIDLVETKEKFIRIIVHELRSPFNSILGFLSLLQKNLRNYDIDKIEKFLTQVYRSATVTFDLLIDLSDWLAAKNKKIPFDPKDVSIYKLLEEEILSNIFCADQKQVSIKNIVPENIMVYADKNMLKTILRNLINNAVKFSEKDSEITILATETEQNVLVTVKDTGCGISAEIIENTFTEGLFSTKGTMNEMGSGLGLLLCKEFIEIEGGTIWVESILGQGSEFKFTLPKTIIV